MKMILKIAGIIVVVLIIGAIIIAKTKGVSPLSWKMHKQFSQKDQVAIAGFDPVSYFENNASEKGDESFTHNWKDVNWNFASEENLEKFKTDPDRYTPKFGGYCSFAVSKGFTATPDPKAWYMHEGKLHLFADEGMKNKWTEQLPAVLLTCEKKWKF